MEEFVERFQRATHISSEYSLYGCHYRLLHDAEHGRILAGEMIPSHACIGEIFGQPAYIWEISHSEYVFIDDDWVLDVSRAHPRQVLSLLRDDNQSECPCNCEITLRESSQHPSGYQFFLIATRPIYVGEELVYAVEMRR